jgi:hypothetical protein
MPPERPCPRVPGCEAARCADQPLVGPYWLWVMSVPGIHSRVTGEDPRAYSRQRAGSNLFSCVPLIGNGFSSGLESERGTAGKTGLKRAAETVRSGILDVRCSCANFQELVLSRIREGPAPAMRGKGRTQSYQPAHERGPHLPNQSRRPRQSWQSRQPHSSQQSQQQSQQTQRSRVGDYSALANLGGSPWKP